jgi:hypothetical protein
MGNVSTSTFRVENGAYRYNVSDEDDEDDGNSSHYQDCDEDEMEDDDTNDAVNNNNNGPNSVCWHCANCQQMVHAGRDRCPTCRGRRLIIPRHDALPQNGNVNDHGSTVSKQPSPKPTVSLVATAAAPSDKVFPKSTQDRKERPPTPPYSSPPHELIREPVPPAVRESTEAEYRPFQATAITSFSRSSSASDPSLPSKVTQVKEPVVMNSIKMVNKQKSLSPMTSAATRPVTKQEENPTAVQKPTAITTTGQSAANDLALSSKATQLKEPEVMNPTKMKDIPTNVSTMTSAVTQTKQVPPAVVQNSSSIATTGQSSASDLPLPLKATQVKEAEVMKATTNMVKIQNDLSTMTSAASSAKIKPEHPAADRKPTAIETTVHSSASDLPLLSKATQLKLPEVMKATATIVKNIPKEIQTTTKPEHPAAARNQADPPTRVERQSEDTASTDAQEIIVENALTSGNHRNEPIQLKPRTENGLGSKHSESATHSDAIEPTKVPLSTAPIKLNGDVSTTSMKNGNTEGEESATPLKRNENESEAACAPIEVETMMTASRENQPHDTPSVAKTVGGMHSNTRTNRSSPTVGIVCETLHLIQVVVNEIKKESGAAETAVNRQASDEMEIESDKREIDLTDVAVNLEKSHKVEVRAQSVTNASSSVTTDESFSVLNSTKNAPATEESEHKGSKPDVNLEIEKLPSTLETPANNALATDSNNNAEVKSTLPALSEQPATKTVNQKIAVSFDPSGEKPELTLPLPASGEKFERDMHGRFAHSAEKTNPIVKSEIPFIVSIPRNGEVLAGGEISAPSNSEMPIDEGNMDDEIIASETDLDSTVAHAENKDTEDRVPSPLTDQQRPKVVSENPFIVKIVQKRIVGAVAKVSATSSKSAPTKDGKKRKTESSKSMAESSQAPTAPANMTTNHNNTSLNGSSDGASFALLPPQEKTKKNGKKRKATSLSGAGVASHVPSKRRHTMRDRSELSAPGRGSRNRARYECDWCGCPGFARDGEMWFLRLADEKDMDERILPMVIDYPVKFLCLSCVPRRGASVATPDTVFDYPEDIAAVEKYNFYLGTKVDYQIWSEKYKTEQFL